MAASDQLRYPIGTFNYDGTVTDEDLERWIDQIATLPQDMRQIVSRLSDEQLETPYRPGGWTLRQVVHHVPDSHLNCYARFKLALTEDEPTIKTYDEARWAELPDCRIVPVSTNLDFLAFLHAKWTALLRAMTGQDFAKRFNHPEFGPTSLAVAVGHYAWHGRHHLAHITSTIEREGW